MKKIRWMDKICNKEVLAQVNETRTMFNIIWSGKHHWIGHVLCHDELRSYYVTLWKEEWLENLQQAGKGYKC